MSINKAALKANIALFNEITTRIMDYATQANEVMNDGRSLEAIGTLCCVQQDMVDADVILKTIFAINRSQQRR